MPGKRFFPHLWLIAVLVGLLTAMAPAAVRAAAAPLLPTRAALAAALQRKGPLALDGRVLDKATLSALYGARDFRPVWTERREQSFLRALEDAFSDGLDPSSYAVTTSRPVARELLLTDAFLRYASALARGRVAPQDFQNDWQIARPAFDAAQVFDQAVAGDVSTVLARLVPHEPEYERLRRAVWRYARLARKPWHLLFASIPIRPGDRGPAVAALRRRLVVEGYLKDSARGDPAFFDATLADAVARFQAAHGLAVDGAVGRLTLAAVNVSPRLRLRQIRWNLERWRSLPRIEAPRRIEVNAAAATATFYEDGKPLRVMPAIVGAPVHPTPVLQARVGAVTFNPPWVVPDSIIKNEITPMLQRDPNYLERFGFAYEDIGGFKELVQQPGSDNSLGRVKLEMPNPDDVFIHDTPERWLFTRTRRYVSHGCVRVAHPRALARLVLDSDEWSRAAIDAAIATGKTRTIPLRKPVPVYLLYWTAFVDPDGTVEFRDDIYGRDRRLAEALAAHAAARRFAASEIKGGSG